MASGCGTGATMLGNGENVDADELGTVVEKRLTVPLMNQNDITIDSKPIPSAGASVLVTNKAVTIAITARVTIK